MAKKIQKKNVKQKLSHLPESMSWLKQTKFVGLGLFVLSVLLYANTFGHQYAQDDAIVVTENMFTTEGLAGLSGIFEYDTFYGFFKEEGKAKLVSGGRYRPLTLAFFALEYQLFGDSPIIMHVFNALWYGLTVVVLYWVLLLLFESRATFDKKIGLTAIYFIPFAAALLFAVYPVHTEAVANIKGRDEIFTLLGSLAAVYFLLKHRKSKNTLHLVLAGVCFFGGLLSKENAITFLAVAPLALYYFTKDSFAQILIKTTPLVIAAVLFLGIRGSILGWDFGQPSSELMNNPFLKIENQRYVPFSSAEKSATITYTLGKYAQLGLVQYPLTHDYYPRHVEVMSWSDWQVLLSLLFYLGLIVWAIKGFFTREISSFGIWFYLLTLSIVSNIIFPVGTNMSERFLFMPSIGVALITAFLMYRFLKKKPRNLLYILGGLTLVYATITLLRNPVWENNYTLFSADIETSPNSAKLRNGMGGELTVQWEKLAPAIRENKKSMLEEAVGHLNVATTIHPNYKQAHFIKGNAFYNLQQYPDAILAYQEALRIDPDYQIAYDNLMVAYRDAGKYYGEQRGDLATALSYLQQAYTAMPEDYETIRLLGVANGVSGNAAKAIEFFQKNTQLFPDNARAWFDLATGYFNGNQAEQGEVALQKARAIDPEIEQKVKENR